ncbi:MAG TPA: ferrous iron transport protein A [Spirochaetaceae bacterium]|jgi:ferrous iron transport protein A|nr:ferrous iron transport protein A [Spirochaetaceae bacterium]
MSDKLRDYSVGDSVVILGYAEGDRRYRNKLLAMGLTKGSVIKLVKVAPMGDPIGIEVRGYELSLRKAEADVLVVGGAL